MKDNFDLYKWKLGNKPLNENKGEFNLYEWNKKRYLGELDIDQYDTLNVNKDDEGSSFNITRGGDDPRMGAELESDRDVVGEASYMYKGYQDKHFDICPTAQRLRDRLKGGEFGEPDELDLGEWLYQHDVLFAIEKQLIKDGEGEPEDFKEARKAADRIINLSRDLNIPGSELGYLKEHLDIIRGIIEYGTLTEKEVIKETLRFIKENNPEFTNEEIKAELQEIKELGKQLSEELCPKGKAYRKRRMAAGEKSSAYLSGRAVKVCKGQISGRKKRKKKK
tara:strand:- start:320 stop:1156 length:837 start_codon:yes stop_codon:yes gene_type:complete